MMEGRGDQGFSVAPQRIGGPPGGRRNRRIPRIGVVVVALVAVAIVAISAIGPRLSGRPYFDISFFATPTPGPTPTPTPPPIATPFVTAEATPLPVVTFPDGTALSGSLVYQTFGLNRLDLATGETTSGADVQVGRDTLFSAPDGETWTCICFEDDEDGVVRTRRVVIRHIGADLREVDVTPLGSFEVKIPVGGGPYDLTSDVDRFDHDRHALLAVVRRGDAPWTISVASIDIAHARLGRSEELAVLKPIDPRPVPSGGSPAPLPSVNPGDQPALDTFIDGPHVRVAPDGGSAYVWVSAQSVVLDGPSATQVWAWRVDLDPDGAIGEVTSAEALAQMPPFCSAIAFAAADRVAYLCPPFYSDQGTSQGWILGTVDPGGDAVGNVNLSPTDYGGYAEPLFDRANGLAYVWDPMGLTMHRVDVHTLTTDATHIDRAASSMPGLDPRGDADPIWGDADSGIEQWSFNQLIGSRDGSRIYAVGFDPVTDGQTYGQPCRGIYVFDRKTLALVDRWAPAANYFAVSTLPDGTVVASGMPRMDVRGDEAQWQASMTLYDPADGRIVARYGQLGEEAPPFLVER